MASFIREEKVDLSKYLPAFLTKDPEFAAKLAAESAVHDEIRQELDDILNQFFVATATWGLTYWEDFLDLPHDETLTDADRRSRIIQKINGSQTVTLDFLTKLVNQYVVDSQAFITDYPSQYALEILYHGGQITDYTKLIDEINTYIPAHIGYKLITYTTGDLICHGAGTVQSYTKETVDMSTNFHHTIDDSKIYTAGSVVHNYKQISIMGGQY
ncbi:MAG: YmfQ family protein [Megasphaera elsdenii]|nr:YmfQ family protein [Megasphaera elsdenii]